MVSRLGVDIGGTFTDFVLIDDERGTVTVEKCLTTPRQPELAIFDGIGSIESGKLKGARISAEVIHATTLITNAIIEKKGVKTGLITTSGFRDVLEMGNETRYYVYDLFQTFPAPIVPRFLRRPIEERTLVDGSVVAPVKEAEIASIVREFQAAGVKSIAVMFLHSYKNPSNEVKTREIIQRIAPEMSVSLSHEVIALPKEFERASTTVIDAYVKPIAHDYMNNLAAKLAESGRSDSVSIMLSNGGIAPVDIATQQPVQLVESGPAAGVEAAYFYGKSLGIDRVLAFDMGGTTAKLCLIKDGKVGRTREFEVARVNRFRKGSGYRLAVPVYNLLEIGAGGGSIARINSIGLLAVGPESAGSEPGPACYGRGGVEPTVTDADVMLGFLDPSSFLGGDFKLDAGAAERAIETTIAKPLNLPVHVAAWGIFDIVTDTMASAARLHLAERGEDPARCTLIASGGAGPVHAVALAKRLGCPTVVVPPLPGLMSAFGLLAARPAYELTRAAMMSLDDDNLNAIEAAFKQLERDTIAQCRAKGDFVIERFVEIRHRGQDSAVEVESDGNWSDPATRSRALQAFADEYLRLFGRSGDAKPLEIAALRVIVAQTRAPLKPPPPPAGGGVASKTRKVRFGESDLREVPVLARQQLSPGEEISGPAIIEERESTTVVWPEDQIVIDKSGSLIIQVGAAKSVRVLN